MLELGAASGRGMKDGAARQRQRRRGWVRGTGAALAAAVFGGLLVGGAVAPVASAAAPAEALAAGPVCSVNVVTVMDVTASYSDENLADQKAQSAAFSKSFVGGPTPATLGVTSFGRTAPLSTAPRKINVDARSQAGADELAATIAGYGFEGAPNEGSSYTNWEAGLREAFEQAKLQGAQTIAFLTDGVPNTWFVNGEPTIGENTPAFEPTAAAHAKAVVEEINAAGITLVPIFVRTNRPYLHGLDDPIAPTPKATVEEAMQALQPGWTIDKAIPLAELAAKLRETALASCSPAITIDKTHAKSDIVDVNGNGFTDAGDTVTWTLTVKNTGDLPLTDVVVTDDTLAKRGVGLENDGKVGDLAVGESKTIRTTALTLTQADVDAGEFVNVACTIGTSAAGVTPKACDDDKVIVDPKPGIQIIKSHQKSDITDVNGNNRVDAGDTVVFTFDVTNTGNVTLKDVVVTDPKLAAAGVKLVGDGRLGTLAPAEMKSVKSEAYTITADDVAKGGVYNVATATGKPPVGPDPKDDDDDTVPVDPAPVVTPTPTPAPQAKTGGALADGDSTGTAGIFGASLAALIAAAIGGGYLVRKRRTATADTTGE